jgi:ADP-heptose:LPS heptosyltransferase
MGLGDWIMASAEARYFNEKTGKKVVFAHSRTGAVQWSEVFDCNPRIEKHPVKGKEYCVVRNHGGTRPYHLGYDAATQCFAWNYKFRAEPGELYLTAEAKKTGQPGAFIIEPNTKPMPLSRNKAWPWDRWQGLVDALDVPWVQLGPTDARSLNGVRRVTTLNFGEALGWLYNASLIVTTDGALHHAAAALGKPAVVLWGGLAPPRILGYDGHTNICHADRWCGSNFECAHCKEAMERITVEEVIDAVKRHRAIQNPA